MILSATDPGITEALLDSRYARRYLAEGDSWFSFGGATGNLLMAIDRYDSLIINCAHPGDELRAINRYGADVFLQLLQPTDGVPQWDAVLLSGGGNDLLCNSGRFIVPDYLAPLDPGALAALLDRIEHHIEHLLGIIQAAQPGVPVLMHTYDYPPVARRWWWWQPGPWLSPVFAAAGIDRLRWNGLAARLVDQLAERLRDIADEYPALRLVDTRDTLLARDWRNEIHPSPAGYAELAKSWRRALALIQPAS